MVGSVIAVERKMAQAPHNVFISSAFIFDLMMTPAAIGLKIGMYGLLVPLTLSLLVLGYIYKRSRAMTQYKFVDAHWRLAFRRSQWLMAGYAISGALIFLAWLLSSTTQGGMQHIMWTALTRIAIMPTLIAVMVTLVMEASAASQAARGEVPEKFLLASD